MGNSNFGGKGPYKLPVDHAPAMQIPPEGASCATCAYLSSAMDACTNKFYQQWAGTSRLPFPAEEYCSDWYEPSELDEETY